MYFMLPDSINYLQLSGTGIYTFPVALVIAGNMFLTNQFVEKVIVEHDVFTGAVTFDILHEIGHGIAGAADRNIADRVHDFLEPLFLPGAVAWIRRCHYFPDEILEAVYPRWRPPGDGFQHR